MKVLELFAGIGGIGLGLERLGWETVAFSEFDPKIAEKKRGRQYAAEVMAKHYPNAVDVGDVTTLKFARNREGIQGVLRMRDACCELDHNRDGDCPKHPRGAYDALYKGDVDVIAGGFPCQDISHAGKGAGIEEGTRSGLWRYFAESIGGLRPRGVIIENVAALSSKGLDRVLIDLAAIDYDAEWDVIPAAGVGAPHLRERMFVIAWPRGGGVHGPWPAPPVFDAWREEPADIPRLVTENVDQRAARLRCLGNAVVPQVAQWVGSVLQTALDGSVGRSYEPSEWDLVKRGRDHAIVGIAERGVDHSIAGMKLPRAGRLTDGVVYERHRSCPQSDAKKVGLANMAPTLRPTTLVPTPTARDATSGPGRADSAQGSPNLRTAVGLLPTPTSRDHKGANKLDRRPVCDDQLPERVERFERLMPTPRASEYKGVGPLGSKSHDYRLEKGYLDATVQDLEQRTGKLNPAWVEWLMGFPDAWTELT